MNDYPQGKLDDVLIHFLHYKTFDEAKICWEKRKKRICYDNIFVIMTDQQNCTLEDMSEFDTVPYPKIMFSNKHINYPWCKYISGFEGEKCVGNTIEYQKYGKRYYEQFDYVGFVNSIKKKE